MAGLGRRNNCTYTVFSCRDQYNSKLFLDIFLRQVNHTLSVVLVLLSLRSWISVKREQRAALTKPVNIVNVLVHSPGPTVCKFKYDVNVTVVQHMRFQSHFPLYYLHEWSNPTEAIFMPSPHQVWYTRWQWWSSRQIKWIQWMIIRTN